MSVHPNVAVAGNEMLITRPVYANYSLFGPVLLTKPLRLVINLDCGEGNSWRYSMIRENKSDQ